MSLLDAITPARFIASASSTDAFAIIKKDHETVKQLFEQFEKAESKAEKKKIAAQAIEELKIHAEIEEKIFYPTVRKDVEDDLMNEADEEHHVAKLLIAELSLMNGSEDHWEAKFTVLAENIRHHIKEEEGEMLPQAKKADVDFDALGEQLLRMKEKLKKTGVPVSDEERLMAASKKLADSPAKAAKLKKPAALKKKPAAKATASRKAAPAKRSASVKKAASGTKRTAASAKKTAAKKTVAKRTASKRR